MNLRVSGSTTIKEFNSSTGEFSDLVNKIVFTETLDFHSGRVRLDLKPFVTRWEGSETNFFERYQSFSYNGKFASVVTYKQGQPGRVYDRLEAKISQKLGEKIDIFKNWTVQGFSLSMLKLANSKIGFIEGLSNPSCELEGPGVPFSPELSFEKDGARSLLRVEFKSSHPAACYKEIIWLDAAKGLSLVRREKHSNICQGATPIISVFKVLSEKEVVKGVWLPTHATIERLAGAKPIQFVEMKIDSINANFPEESDTFNAPIKVGTYVEDERYGVSFTAGDSAETIVEKLNKQESLK